MSTNNFAIVSLCMLNEHYVIGSCISAFIHKFFIKKYKKKIDLVIMCDENIYTKYYNILNKYYDKIIKIDLDYFPINNNFIYSKEKYISWVSYSTNKWKCLEYTEYKKILFLDVDMLPSNPDFYNIFDFNTPAIKRCRMEPYENPLCNKKFEPFIGNSYDEFVSNYANIIGTLDGGIVLLEPSKELYSKYKKLINELFKNKGIYSSNNSFPDETSLFYLLCQEKKTLYTICNEYSVIPWSDNSTPEKQNYDTALLYNYNSFYKPWIKGRNLQYPEELLWHNIYDIMPFDNELDILYKTVINQHYTETFLKLERKQQKTRYNLSYKIINLHNLNEKNEIKNYGNLNMKYLGKLFEKNIKRLIINDDFPYRNKLYNDNDRIEKFKKLLNYELIHVIINKKPSYINITYPLPYFLYKGEYHYITYKVSDYWDVFVLSDFFNDECRMKCAFGSSISPYEYYQKNKENIINSLKSKNIEITDLNIRNNMYGLTRECSNHNPAIIKYFIKKYKARKILDISSGWGDRLLGALSCDIDLYFGTDPNGCLHPNYKKMIDLLKPLSPNSNAEFNLNHNTFENVNITYNDFDLIFTSPPYFDYEKYTEEKGQSHLSYNTENKWLEEFLKVSILKALNKLKYNGYLVLYFSQEKGKTYMEKFLEWIITLEDIYYIGCMFYSVDNFKSPHPIFIYKKTKKIPSLLYNPKPIIKKINYENKNYKVFNDNFITGGTKTRAAISLFKKIFKEQKIKQMIYGGASNGYAQVAIAYSLYLLKKFDIKLIFVFQDIKDDETEQLRELTKFYHKNTEFILKNGTMKDLYPIVDSYTKEGDYIIPFGFSFKKYKKILFKKLKKHLEKYKIKRLWLVVGSGTILYTLQKILINTHFMGVQVGRTIKDNEIYDKNRLTLFISSYTLYQKYNGYIPFDTLSTYDGKLVEFLKDNGNEGDYIWNVGGIHKYM